MKSTYAWNKEEATQEDTKQEGAAKTRPDGWRNPHDGSDVVVQGQVFSHQFHSA
jgi:hypothetical protein